VSDKHSSAGTAEQYLTTVDFIDAVVEHTRARGAVFWFPMIVFGTISLAAALVALVAGYEWIGLHWMIFGPIGGFVTTRFYTRHERLQGLIRSALPYFALVVFLAAGNFLLALTADGDPGAATTIWTGICYLGFAALERSSTIALSAGALVACGFMLLAADVADPSATGAAFTGLALLIGGFTLRRRYHHA